MKKRIIACLLAAVLLLGLMPTALAAGGVPQVHSSEGEITVKFDSNGGRTVSDKTFASAEALLAATLSKPYQYSKVFEGWYLKDETKPDNFGKALSEAAAADFEGKTEVTLIAKWRNRQYVIKFQPNGGTGTMADQRADFDADVKLNECTFVKEGFECAGWALYSGASKPTYTDTINREWDDGDEYLEEEGSEDGEEVKLYAIWQKQRSEEEKEAEAKLNAAEAAISGTYNPKYGTDTNALTMLQTKLTAAGITDVTVSVKAGASDNHSSYNHVGVSDDGTLEYKWNNNGVTTSSSGTVRPVFVLTYKTTTRETTECLFNLSLDEAKALAALRAASKAILDGLPNEVSNSDDLTNKLLKCPLREGVTPDKADYDYGTNLYTVYTGKWTSSNSAVLAIGTGDWSYKPYKATVMPAQTDTQLTLTLKLEYNGRTDLNVSGTHTLTVKAAQAAPVDYTKLLNAALTAPNALRDASTGKAVSKDAVAGDVFVPSAPFIRDNLSNLGPEYKHFYNDKTPIRFFSSDPSVITIDGTRATVYRPLPGGKPAKVTLTAQIRLRTEGAPAADFDQFNLLAEQSIELTVLPMVQSEIDAAAAFMEKVCTSDVYWEGIKDTNTAKDDITANLHGFMEIVPDGDGYRFVYLSKDRMYQYVEVDDLIDTSDIDQTGIPYNKFRSSNNAVITHESLLVTKPEYDSQIKIDSLLTHSVYGKYYEKFKDNAAYAGFAKFYKQPVSVTVTVKGEKGAPNPPAPATSVHVTVSIDGSLATQHSFVNTTSASYGTMSDAGKTAWDAVSTVLTDNQYTYVGDASYLSSVTDTSGVTLSGGDSRYGAWSGWMYTVNGKEPVGDNGYGLTLGQYDLQDGDVILFHFVQCPTENGLHQFKEEPAVAATCVSTGKTALKRCTVTSGEYGCGFTVGGEIIPVDPDNHTHLEPVAAVASTCTVKGHKAGQKCTDCDAIIGCAELPLAPHSWDAGVVTVQPTYVSTGVRVYTCSVCKQTRSEVIEKLSSTNIGTNTGTPAVPSQRPDSELPRQRFGDVPQNIWFASGVQFAAEQGLFTGVSANEFAPYDPMTRAMLVTVLHRLDGADASGTNSFTDVLNGKWYTNAIAWASANGIVEGLSGNRFAPNAPIAREQLAAILFRYAKACGYDVSARAELTAYADSAQVSTWAGDAMRWAVAAGLISGRSGAQLAPKGEATRAEVAVILMNFVQKVVK